MISRSWLGATALTLLVALAGCVGEVPPGGHAQLAPVQPPTPPAGPPRVALLLPLTGPRGDLGAAMLKAAQMALSVPGGPMADIRDTAGDPAKAGEAAQAAVAAGDRLILGPLTAEETVAVAAIAQPAGVPVLAFTSDPAAGGSGVWPLGLTPGQQMRRLVAAARDDGRQRLAAVLPQGALGDALQTAVTEAASDAGLPPPVIQRNDPGIASFTDALKIVSNYDARRGELQARIKAARAHDDADSRQLAAELAAKPVEPPPFDALLIGESGATLAQAAEVLGYYDVAGPQVRVLGPALWSQQTAHLGKLAGAWYAALDPATRGEFVAAYQAKYGAAPPPIADFAFDAAAIARALNGENDFSVTALTRSEGFTGVDGGLLLLPDGHVRRALAVWQVEGGGWAHIVSPAPQDITQPGS